MVLTLPRVKHSCLLLPAQLCLGRCSSLLAAPAHALPESSAPTLLRPGLFWPLGAPLTLCLTHLLSFLLLPSCARDLASGLLASWLGLFLAALTLCRAGRWMPHALAELPSPAQWCPGPCLRPPGFLAWPVPSRADLMPTGRWILWSRLCRARSAPCSFVCPIASWTCSGFLAALACALPHALAC